MGTKRLSITQVERQQRLREKREGSTERRSRVEKAENAGRSALMPDLTNREVLNDISGMKVLTPASVASRFNLRLSVAKDFLEELEKRGLVEPVATCSRLRIYRPRVD